MKYKFGRKKSFLLGMILTFLTCSMPAKVLADDSYLSIKADMRAKIRSENENRMKKKMKTEMKQKMIKKVKTRTRSDKEAHDKLHAENTDEEIRVKMRSENEPLLRPGNKTEMRIKNENRLKKKMETEMKEDWY